MPEIYSAGPNRTTQDRRLLWLLLFLPVIMALSGVWILDHTKANKPLFSMTAFLADVNNILVDEGDLYSFLAVAVALLLFDVQARTMMSDWSRAVLFAVAVDGIYLSKSGALRVVLVLTAGFLVVERRAT